MVKVMLLVVFLALCAAAEPWQAAGNFSSENITDIRAILSSKELLLGSSLTLQQLAKAISDDLNAKWNPAWNVFVSVPMNAANPKDMVQYGYGFNDHWLWYNGFGANNYSYAIWKDYNCYNWVDVYINSPMTAAYQGEAETSSITTTIKRLIVTPNGILSSYATDQWLLTNTFSAFSFVQNGRVGAWSSVIAEDSSIFTGRFCNYYASGFNNYGAAAIAKGTIVNKNWNFLVFKTRG